MNGKQQEKQSREAEGRLEVRAPTSLLDELRAIGARHERNLSAEVRWALGQHVRRERETPEASNAAT